MRKLPVCQNCIVNCGERCTAIDRLTEVYQEIRREEKTKIISQLRKELNIKDYEVSEEMRILGKK